jgi:hypothetical protein
MNKQHNEPAPADSNLIAETYVSPGPFEAHSIDDALVERKHAEGGSQKFDLRNRLKRAGRVNNGAEAPGALAEGDVAEQSEGPLRGRVGAKDVKTRLGVRAAGSEAAGDAPAEPKAVPKPKNGREFSGLVTGVTQHRANCWVIPDVSSENNLSAGTKHYLLYEDLPSGFEVMKDTRVDYDLIPGNKSGQFKCSRIFVHQPGRSAGQNVPDTQLVSDGSGEHPSQQPQANKKEGKKKGAKKQAAEAKKLPLSTDPEEEARRKRRAERFGLSYTPLDE